MSSQAAVGCCGFSHTCRQSQSMFRVVLDGR